MELAVDEGGIIQLNCWRRHLCGGTATCLSASRVYFVSQLESCRRACMTEDNTLPTAQNPITWYVMNTSAPSCRHRFAIPQAIERALATPTTSARLPCNIALPLCACWCSSLFKNAPRICRAHPALITSKVAASSHEGQVSLKTKRPKMESEWERDTEGPEVTSVLDEQERGRLLHA